MAFVPARSGCLHRNIEQKREPFNQERSLKPWLSRIIFRRMNWSVILVSFMLILLLPLGAFAAEAIKIGVPGPFSGSSAEKGTHLKYGVMLAAEEVNAAGGLMGSKIELVFADTEAKPEVGVSAYEKLITRDKVSFIVGEVNSHVALAIMDVVAKYQTPTILAIPAADDLGAKVQSDLAKYGCIFMADIPISRMQEGAFVFLEDAIKSGKLKIKDKTVALVYEDSSWGRIVGKTWKENLEKLGWKVVLEEVTPFKESQYLPIVSKIKKLNPDMVKVELTSLPAGVAITKAIQRNGCQIIDFRWLLPENQRVSRNGRSFCHRFFQCKGTLRQMVAGQDDETVSQSRSHREHDAL